MKLSQNSEVILNVQDVFDGLYSGKITSLDNLLLEDHLDLAKFLDAVKKNHDKVGDIKIFQDTGVDQKTFDTNNQQIWFMPKEYQDLDIIDLLLDKTTNEEEYQRVVEELALFAQHNMLDVLKYLKYLVDTMRQHNIVWGVGRGSSVASYCLYLIGVHKINSIKYNLDIHEFLK